MEASHDDEANVASFDNEEERTWKMMKTFGKTRAPKERYIGGSVPKRTKLR